MKLSVREMKIEETVKMVDYFLESDPAFLTFMGAEISKLPKRKQWLDLLVQEYEKPFNEKEFYYVSWLLDDRPIGHSNINYINFGQSATMHLHLWEGKKRKGGFGETFVRLSIPYYFDLFNLEVLISEPNAQNIAPQKTLGKVGFEFIRTYETVPGWINFHQAVSRYELKKESFERLRKEWED